MTSRQSLLRGNDVRKSDRPVLVGGPARPTVECESAATVTEVRSPTGDIQEIHVTCECGKVTVISCQYDGAVSR